MSKYRDRQKMQTRRNRSWEGGGGGEGRTEGAAATQIFANFYF